MRNFPESGSDWEGAAFFELKPKGLRYEHLPYPEQEVLSEWQYKGVRPTERTIGPVRPTVAYSTVDIKLPETGPSQILEINGYTSGLSGYGEERGDTTLRERINSVISCLELPVGRYFWQPESHVGIDRRPHPFRATTIRDLIGDPPAFIGPDHAPWSFESDLNLFEDQFVGEYLDRRRAESRIGRPAGGPGPERLEDAAVLIELVDPDNPPFVDFDPPDAIVANPAEIRRIEEDKLEFASVSAEIGAGKYRPRWGRFRPALGSLGNLWDLDRDESIDRVVLKAPNADAGSGVVILERGEFKMLRELANRLGSWDAMLKQLGGDGFHDNASARYYRGNGQPELLVEEYVPSKPLRAPDGAEYDATMRVVITTIANIDKVTVVPIGAYWKLPEHPNGFKNAIANSRIREGGSLPVSDTDFRRAFRDTADFMNRVVKHTRGQRRTRLTPAGWGDSSQNETNPQS